MLRVCAVALFSILLFLGSCSGNKDKNTSQALSYFDVKGYFEKEAVRLTALNPWISKEIDKNTSVEAKKIKINDWTKEFNLFIESDINKPSWISSYSVKQNQDTTIYAALYPDLRTREIKIVKDGDQLHFISIENEAVNKLYTSKETLTYSPDSVYQIVKSQEVMVIGRNDYKITGSF